MSETRAQQEPSMEEILASIRRMITEDDPARGRTVAAEVVRPQTSAPSLSADDDVLELTEALDDPRPVAAPPAAESAPEDESVVSPASASAALAALARLNAAAAPAAVAVHKSQTVDDLVREMLRPLLKEWLDANLPRLVEQAVEREVSRIANGAVRR
ncbi:MULTISPECIES: DUF2497 domain-containing protein [Inquilinus]|uniref:DUF2497 domain-containing protein n=1 Tax=Inquilinus ginsengisoli TaxID=363840 RepID=A0ABU1JNH0_9PROT|nr:DUF2497 domain-containing protein [Inquilinus ginsengisoli]MDR6290169.1 hypothetical protein [Inquilinus ginsengisoli]